MRTYAAGFHPNYWGLVDKVITLCVEIHIVPSTGHTLSRIISGKNS